MICHSEQISNIAAALLKAQRDIGHALKSAENPYFKSRYADLTVVIESVKTPLNENGITFLQAVDSNEEGVPVIDTILLHESGQYLSTRTPVFCNKPNDPQAFGSGVTYSKRYALQAILGLPTEDDDAESATTHDDKRKPAAYQKPTPKPEPVAKPGHKIIDPNDPVLKEAMKTAVEQSFIDYQDLHKDEMPEGKIFCEKYFKAEVWAAFKKLTLTQQKKMTWCLESVNNLAESILAVNCLTDIKVDPMA